MLSAGGFTGLISINQVALEIESFLTNFACGRKDLDDFLFDCARDQHEDHLSHTSTLFHEDFKGLVGYITLTNDSVGMEMSEVGELGLRNHVDLKFYPAIKICRLGIHQDLQGLGIGQKLIDLALGEILLAQSITASRLLITDAVNDPQVIRFYEKCGFLESYWATNQRKKNRGTSVPATIKMIRDIYA
jgi:ribosomal protein S18 acetylase RimI-like enzyme